MYKSRENIVKKVNLMALCLIVSLLIAGIIYGYVGRVLVNGISMYPTYENGQMVKYEKQDTYQSGDVIIFWIKDSNTYENLIKRVIATGGDTIKGENGKVYVNDSPVYENYLSKDTVTWDFDTVTVPEDEYFVMGDNRTSSKDSRIFGCIKKENIRGKVVE